MSTELPGRRFISILSLLYYWQYNYPSALVVVTSTLNHPYCLMTCVFSIVSGDLLLVLEDHNQSFSPAYYHVNLLRMYSKKLARVLY